MRKQSTKTAIFALALSLLLLVGVKGADVAASERSDQDTVEDASQLIKELVTDTEEQISELNSYWKETDSLLRSAVNAVAAQQQGQQSECDGIQSDRDETQNELDNTSNYVDWISNRIKENIQKVDDLESKRCDSSKLYVESIKHNKIALSLIQFLRQAVQQRDQLSLAQRQQIMQRLVLFTQMYRDNRIKELIQTKMLDDYDVETDTSVAGRSDEEIGTKHIDDGRERIAVSDFESSERRDWPQYKAELLQLLDDLEAQIRGQMERAQDDEVNSGISLAEFKIRVDQENRDLDRYLSEEVARYGELKATLEKRNTALATCQAQLDVVNRQLADAQSQYQEQVDDYDAKKKELQDQLETFRYVQALYRTGVEAQDSQYRDQINDIIN